MRTLNQPKSQGYSQLKQGLGFGVWGLGFRVWGLGFRVLGLGFEVQGLGCAKVLLQGFLSLPTAGPTSISQASAKMSC